MRRMAFVHLRPHTDISVVDGTVRIDDAVAAAAADGRPALAITDLANLFGTVKFYSAARGAGVKPIVGADVWLEPDGERRAAVPRCCCWCRTAQGYLQPVRLLSRAWLAATQQRGQRRARSGHGCDELAPTG